MRRLVTSPHGIRVRAAASGFFRDASVMLIGTTLGQAASVLLAPALTRIYSAEQFGFVSVYTAVLAVFGVTAALGLDVAIPLAASECELISLVAGASLAVIVTSACVGLGMWLAPTWVLAGLWLGPLDSHRYLLPLGLACVGFYYVMVAAATWAGSFGDIARTRIAQGLSGPLSQIALGIFGAGESGLAIGFILGQSSGVWYLVRRAVPRPHDAMSWRTIRMVIARYLHFPLFASWTRVIEMAGSGAILFVLFSAFYSTEIVGFMFLAERVIMRPLLMVSTSLLQVFSGEAGRAARHDPVGISRRFRQVVLGQSLFALAWIVPINLVAGFAVPLLFGRAWIAAVPCLHALSLAYLALAVLHPVSTTLQLLNRQILAAGWQVLRLGSLIVAIVLSSRAGLPAVSALWVCSAVQAIACAGILATMAICVRRVAVEPGNRSRARRVWERIPLLQRTRS